MRVKVRGGYVYEDPLSKIVHLPGDVLNISEDEYKGKITLFENLEKKVEVKEIKEEEVTNRMINTETKSRSRK
ncbi:MAG: hypothetical protein WC346_18580 [Methanogenium sp.]